MTTLAIASFTDGRGGTLTPQGDVLLRAALETSGCQVVQGVWSDPAFRWDRLDGVVVRSCWDYHLRPTEFAAWIRRLEEDGVPVVNEPGLIRWNSDKVYLRDLHDSGVAIPETEWLEEGSSLDIQQLCQSRAWRSAVVKPRVSAGAYRTELCTTGMAYGPCLVQEFVPEIRLEGEWSLMFFNGAYSHAVRKAPARGDFRVQVEFGGKFEALKPETSMVAFAANVLAQAPTNPVLARVDIVVCARRGPLLMELEAIEPELFFSSSHGSERLAAEAIVHAMECGPPVAAHSSALCP